MNDELKKAARSAVEWIRHFCTEEECQLTGRRGKGKTPCYYPEAPKFPCLSCRAHREADNLETALENADGADDDALFAYLKSAGFDGLYHVVEECACAWDDVAPCGQFSRADCRPGHCVPCRCGCGESHDYHMVGPWEARVAEVGLRDAVGRFLCAVDAESGQASALRVLRQSFDAGRRGGEDG